MKIGLTYSVSQTTYNQIGNETEDEH